VKLDTYMSIFLSMRTFIIALGSHAVNFAPGPRKIALMGISSSCLRDNDHCGIVEAFLDGASKQDELKRRLTSIRQKLF
jgi:hypothetical protein